MAMIEASRFTLRQLACFVAACEEGGVGRAAERLRLAQATVSEAIADLERSTGAQLLVRAPRRRAVPSPAGRDLLDDARAVLAAASRFDQHAAGMRGSVSGEIPVGCLVTLAPAVVPQVFSRFEGVWPEARAALRTGDQRELLGWLAESAVDVAITYDLGLDDRVSFDSLRRFPPYVLLGAGHRLARRRSVGLAELAAEPLVLLDLPLSREYFHGLFRDAGQVPTVARRATDPELVRSFVAHGHGYTLANVLPAPATAADGAPLVTVAVRGRPRALRLGLARRSDVAPTRTAAAFADACAEVLGH